MPIGKVERNREYLQVSVQMMSADQLDKDALAGMSGAAV